MGVSINEIADYAGVARITVYRTLANHPSISGGTRARVVRAIQELGYPRLQKRGRMPPHPGMALWLPGLSLALATPYVADAVAALESEVARRRNSLRILSAPLPESPADMPLELLRENFQGVFTVAFYSDRHLGILARRWPVVSLFSTREVPGVVSISPDYAGAARLAVEHLAELGHRRIALVVGQVRERNFSRLFLDGYSGAMVHAGLTPDPRLIHSHDGNVGHGEAAILNPPGLAAARELLDRPEKPTAIVARQDSLPGILKALADRGLKLPDDVSVVGCGTESLASSSTPRLTVVSFSANSMAELALQMVTSVPAQGVRMLVPLELQPGESTGRVKP